MEIIDRKLDDFMGNINTRMVGQVHKNDDTSIEEETWYDELKRTTQVGSGSYQSAALKALASQIPGYNYPTVGSEQGGNDPYGIQDLLTKYGQ